MASLGEPLSALVVLQVLLMLHGAARKLCGGAGIPAWWILHGLILLEEVKYNLGRSTGTP